MILRLMSNENMQNIIGQAKNELEKIDVGMVGFKTIETPQHLNILCTLIKIAQI